MILDFFGGAGGGPGTCCDIADAGTELGRMLSSCGETAKDNLALAGDCRVAVLF